MSWSALVARSRFCRLCLRKSDTYLLPLLARMDKKSVMDMLVDVIGLELEANDLYPTKVCTNCMTKLDFAYKVRQEFLASSETLLKLAVENRLSEYYERIDIGKTGVAEQTSTDEILLNSRSILESRVPKVDESLFEVEQLEEDSVGEDEMETEVIEEEYKIQPDQVDEDEAHDIEEPAKEPEVKTPEPAKEKYVYSWRELVKPKSAKKQQRKNLPKTKQKNKPDDLQFPQTTCYICDTEHETLEQRDEHLNEHVPMVPHRCDLCSTDEEPVVSKSVLTLNRHRLMHRLPYKCDHCFRRFISSGSQYTHIWSTHMGNSEGLTCDYCGKVFSQKRSFQAHVRRHRYKANGKYKCETCGDTCGSSLLLARHQRKHTGEKNFACPYCEKSFSRACNLLTHKRIHTNERCHKCPECGNSFRDSVTLRKHRERFHLGKLSPAKTARNPYIITADGLKQFMCKFDGCSFTTTNSTAISRHKARHTKRYECGDCGKRFAEPNLVRRHQASMHSAGRNVREKAPESEATEEQAEHEDLDGECFEDVPLKAEPVYEVEIIEEEDGKVKVVQVTM